MQDNKKHGGELYFNLGDLSEDVLKDGKKAYESGKVVLGDLARIKQFLSHVIEKF